MSSIEKNSVEDDLYAASLRIKLKLVQQMEKMLDGEPSASVIREARQMLQGMGLFDAERQKHTQRMSEQENESELESLLSEIPTFAPKFPKVRSVDD